MISDNSEKGESSNMRVTYIIELKKKDDWSWRLRASNGRVLAESLSYKTKHHCKKIATKLRHDLAQARGVVATYEEHA